MNDELTANGAAVIQKQIDEAVACGKNSVIVSGKYELDKAVVLPSDFTLYLENCVLRLADNTFCRIFENRSVSDIGKGKPATYDRNIRIIGKENVLLDGGNYNGLGERNYSKSPYHISVNNAILFANVEFFEISGIKIVNQRWWAINIVNCHYGAIRNVAFCSDYTRLLSSGERVKGLLRSDFEGTYIKNSDGIDLRRGCHDIEIDGISGFTEDDTVALTALKGSTERIYSAEDAFNGIRNITIKNINACAYCTIVRLLNQDGTEMNDITIDHVCESDYSEYMDGGIFAVRIGDEHAYGDRNNIIPPRNVTVKNVCGSQKILLDVACHVDNGVYENIEGECRIDGKSKRQNR